MLNAEKCFFLSVAPNPESIKTFQAKALPFTASLPMCKFDAFVAAPTNPIAVANTVSFEVRFDGMQREGTNQVISSA